jgi:hypothetical protein
VTCETSQPPTVLVAVAEDMVTRGRHRVNCRVHTDRALDDLHLQWVLLLLLKTVNDRLLYCFWLVDTVALVL